MRKFIKDWGATIGALVVIVGAFSATMTFVGWPPYAAKSEVAALAVQVSANTEASLRQQLRNAKARGDKDAINDICDAIQKLYGYTPKACR